MPTSPLVRTILPRLLIWTVVTGISTWWLTEWVLEPLREQGTVHTIARVAALASGAFAMLMTLAAAVAFGAIAWRTLRWIDVAAEPAALARAVSAGFNVLTARAVATILVLLVGPWTPTADDLAANTGDAATLFRILELMQGAAMVGAVLMAVWAIRREIRCRWEDALAACLVSSAAIVGIDTLVGLLTPAELSTFR